MKTLIAAALFSFSMFNIAVAEPYIDAGNDGIQQTSSSNYTASRTQCRHVVRYIGFKDKNTIYVETNVAVSPDRMAGVSSSRSGERC